MKLKQIYLRISLDLPSLSSLKNRGKAHKMWAVIRIVEETLKNKGL